MTHTEQVILDQLARTRADVLTLKTILIAFLQNQGLWTAKADTQHDKNVAIFLDAVTDQMAKVLSALTQERPSASVPHPQEQP